MILAERSKISPPTTPGLQLGNLSLLDPNENKNVAILSNQDDLLGN